MTDTEQQLRRSLPPLPKRWAHLPLNEKGYPVPKFVAWVDGKADFRVSDYRHLVKCINKQVCWLCGDTLGKYKVFVIGPMCAVNRVSGEPPCHRECAEYAVITCPFMVRPKAVRREANLPEDTTDPAGVSIPRNPGVTLLWITDTYSVQKEPNGVLFRIGNPIETLWYREGRTATREEVVESIRSGLPTLTTMAAREGRQAVVGLQKALRQAATLLPRG